MEIPAARPNTAYYSLYAAPMIDNATTLSVGLKIKDQENDAVNITLLLFAGLAESVGTTRLSLTLEREALTVQQLKDTLCELYPAAASLIRISFVACNQSYASDETTITAADEIALIPPVSGGQPEAESSSSQASSANNLFTLSYDVLSTEETCAKVQDSRYGAVIAFIGTTREYTNGQRTVLLEYEAYAPMAIRTMEQIGEEIDARWPGALCAISHRLGTVPLGEISVVIAVAAPHRAECYDASRYAIERLKQIVPIWKKEIWEDGSEWKGHQLGPWNPLQP
ncbi:MAG: molybdopterin biosynthesis MoaE protein [Paenibacillus sp.]|nr:molybdopterin biosynthesis MoaE protein [Paenibacillus sp.]